MDVISALGGIGSAFGLSSSAGLNAYIPLLVVALAGRFPAGSPLIRLGEPYDALTSWWTIGVLAVLLIIEMTVDKIPAVDTINDVVQTLVRPVAGAVLFAANANVITDLSPVLALVLGLILAGGVHATKATVRPAITATTAGTGNWAVSIIEDVAAFFVSLLAVLVPILAVMLVVAILAAVFVYWRRRRHRRRQPAFDQRQ
jgi:hypothetical protein